MSSDRDNGSKKFEINSSVCQTVGGSVISKNKTVFKLLRKNLSTKKIENNSLKPRKTKLTEQQNW